jgi:hypothetical protein
LHLPFLLFSAWNAPSFILQIVGYFIQVAG